MPHGTPDWGLVGPKYTTFGLDDLGEHAVRLGSPHLWDRRGDVVVQDTFEHGLGQARPDVSGLAASVVLEGGVAWHGAFCIKFTTGSHLSRYAGLEYRHGLFVNSKVGLEFTFTVPTPEEEPEVTLSYWEWYIWLQRVGTYQYAGVRYDIRNEVLEHQVDGVNWTPFADDVQLNQGDRIWHTGKLVGDYNTVFLARFILNEHVWPLDLIPMYEWGAGGVPYIRFIVRLSGQKDQNQIGYVDNVIITQNEP